MSHFNVNLSKVVVHVLWLICTLFCFVFAGPVFELQYFAPGPASPLPGGIDQGVAGPGVQDKVVPGC